MFYLPISLREITERTTPKGPNFKYAREVSVNLGGSVISLKLPRHQADGPYDAPIHLRGYVDIERKGFYIGVNPVGGWESREVLHRSWRFNGPMFSGKLGNLHFVMMILHRPLEQGKTLFNPKVFEQVQQYLLTEEYAEKKSHWASCWRAPVAWQRHHHLPVFACSFDVIPLISANSVAKNFNFPITRDCFINLYFCQDQAMSGSLEKKDALIDRSTMEQLCNDVIASTRLELSPQSQQQLEEAQARYPHETLSEQMEPLKWTTAEEDAKHAEVLIANAEFAAAIRESNKYKSDF